MKIHVNITQNSFLCKGANLGLMFYNKQLVKEKTFCDLVIIDGTREKLNLRFVDLQ